MLFFGIFIIVFLIVVLMVFFVRKVFGGILQLCFVNVVLFFVVLNLGSNFVRWLCNVVEFFIVGFILKIMYFRICVFLLFLYCFVFFFRQALQFVFESVILVLFILLKGIFIYVRLMGVFCLVWLIFVIQVGVQIVLDISILILFCRCFLMILFFWCVQ